MTTNAVKRSESNKRLQRVSDFEGLWLPPCPKRPQSLQTKKTGFFSPRTRSNTVCDEKGTHRKKKNSKLFPKTRTVAQPSQCSQAHGGERSLDGHGRSGWGEADRQRHSRPCTRRQREEGEDNKRKRGSYDRTWGGGGWWMEQEDCGETRDLEVRSMGYFLDSALLHY